MRSYPSPYVVHRSSAGLFGVTTPDAGRSATAGTPRGLDLATAIDLADLLGMLEAATAHRDRLMAETTERSKATDDSAQPAS